VVLLNTLTRGSSVMHSLGLGADRRQRRRRSKNHRWLYGERRRPPGLKWRAWLPEPLPRMLQCVSSIPSNIRLKLHCRKSFRAVVQSLSTDSSPLQTLLPSASFCISRPPRAPRPPSLNSTSRRQMEGRYMSSQSMPVPWALGWAWRGERDRQRGVWIC
jgi:hypothetical protein